MSRWYKQPIQVTTKHLSSGEKTHIILSTYFKWQYTWQAAFCGSCGLIQVLRHYYEGLRKHVNLHQDSSVPATIWARHLSHTSLQCYHYTSPFYYHLPICCSNLFTSCHWDEGAYKKWFYREGVSPAGSYGSGLGKMANKIMNLQVAFSKSYRMFRPAYNLLAGLQ